MKRATFLKASLISKGIIATCAIVGFLMQMTLHGWHGLRYYTNQSNLLVGVFMVYLLLKYRKDGHWSKMDLRLKGGVTVAILLTGLVYHCRLSMRLCLLRLRLSHVFRLEITKMARFRTSS